MNSKNYNCRACGYGPRPVLLENKSAVAVLSDFMFGSGDDAYSVIAYPKRHIRQREFTAEENESFASLFSKAIQLVGRAASIDITTIGSHQAGDIPGGHWQVIYECGETPRGHYFQKAFPAKKLASKELKDLAARLQNIS